MKRIILICMVFVLMVTISGCSSDAMFMKNFHSDEEIANAQMEKFLKALESRDTEQLFSLFSANARSEMGDMQETVDLLYSYYQGNYLSYNNWSATNSSTSREDSHIVKEIYGTYDVTTNVGVYRFAFLYVDVDSAVFDNIGLRSVYVIKMEDDTDPQLAYRGDDLYTPGIHIGVPNNLPDEE